MSWVSSFHCIDCKGGPAQDIRCQLYIPRFILVRPRNNPCIQDMQQLWNKTGMDPVCRVLVGAHMQFLSFSRIHPAIHLVEGRATHDFASNICPTCAGCFPPSGRILSAICRRLEVSRAAHLNLAPALGWEAPRPLGAPSHVEEDIPVTHSGPVRR